MVFYLRRIAVARDDLRGSQRRSVKADRSKATSMQYITMSSTGMLGGCGYYTNNASGNCVPDYRVYCATSGSFDNCATADEPQAYSTQRRLPMSEASASSRTLSNRMTSIKKRLFLIILLLAGCSKEHARPPSEGQRTRNPPYRIAEMMAIPKRALNKCSPEQWTECLAQHSHLSEARPTILLQSLDPSIFDQHRFAPGTWNGYP